MKGSIRNVLPPKPSSWSFSLEIEFFFYIAGIYVSYLLFGLFQEKLNERTFGPSEVKFKNTSFLLLVQCLLDVIGAYFVVKLFRIPPDSVPIFEYIPIAFTYISAMFCSNYAIHFVSYPVMVLAKSCKPIPVMILSRIVLRNQQSLLKYICVLLITTGVIFFVYEMEGHNKTMHSSSNFGLSLLALSLTLDGITGPFQEKLKKTYESKPAHMMFWCNLLSALFLSFELLFTGHGMEGIRFCLQFPEVITDILGFGITSAIGQIFIYLTLFKFGSLTLSLVTTTRKFFTIVFSVILFGHKLSLGQWLGISFVFLGLGVDIFNSYRPKRAVKTHIS